MSMEPVKVGFEVGDEHLQLWERSRLFRRVLTGNEPIG
jgi:hypothetical protein